MTWIFQFPKYSNILPTHSLTHAQWQFLVFYKRGPRLKSSGLPRGVSNCLNLTSKNWEEQGQRRLYISKIKTKFTIYCQQCFYLYLQKKTRWYQKDNLQTKNSNIALSIPCLNTTDLWISQFKSSLIQQECVQRPAGVWNKMLIPHKATNPSNCSREVQTVNCFRKWEGRRHPTHLTLPQTFTDWKQTETILDMLMLLSARALQLVYGTEQRAPGGTGAAHATVRLSIQQSG